MLKQVVLASTLLFSTLSQALPIIYDPIGGHSYMAVSSLDTDFNSANFGAQSTTLNGYTGYLATITSAEENSFIWDSYAAQGYNLWGYLLGGLREYDFSSGNAVPTESFYWINGESWSYEAWASDQPDNFGGWEGVLSYWYDGTWNDTDFTNGYDTPNDTHYHLGYVIEFDGMINAVDEPGHLVLFGLAGLAAVRRMRRSV